MNKRTGWLFFSSAGIVLALFRFWRSVNRPVRETGAPKTPATAVVKSESTSRPILERIRSRPVKNLPPPHRKLSEGELPGQVVSQVAASPDANTPDGDYATAVALQRCAYASGTDAEIEERETRESLQVDALRQRAGLPLSDKVAVNETVDAIVTMKRERDSCAGIPKNVVSSWRVRLEAMAQAGDTEAGQRLIRSISIEFPTQFEIDANPDEYAQRMALAEEYLLDQVASGDCSQATLTSLATMGFDPGLSYASYRVYAERTLASMPRPNLTLDENVKMISGIKNRLAEFQAQVPSDAMDDANQTVAYWQQTNCRL